MFKIVHCKTTDEDAIQILENVEETSLSAVPDDDGDEDDDGDLDIEESEYVHPETEEYFDEEEEETGTSTENTEHHIQIDELPKCTYPQKGISHKIKFGLNKCILSRPCSICVYLCLTLMVLASIVSLVVISVLIVAPYTKAASYELSNCTTVRVNIDPEDRRCSCGKGCSSLYPCLQIRVVIEAVNYSSVNNLRSSILYENEAVFMRKVGGKSFSYVRQKISCDAFRKFLHLELNYLTLLVTLTTDV